MNIDTDTQFAFAKEVGTYVEATPKAFKHQIDPDDGKPYKKVYDLERSCELVSLAWTSVFKRLLQTLVVGKSVAAN